MAAEEKWYFTKEDLNNTPSRKCGYDNDKELSYRQQAANFIQDMGQRLRVTLLCINTAIVYMHRFYIFHSFTQFPWHSIASSSLFLAAKVEEQPRKLEHVIKVAHVCLHREAQIDIKSEQYMELAQDLVFNENVLLQTLGFDVAIDHPHTHVVRCCHLIRASKDLAQTSYFMASNSLHLTTMCVQYKPTVVACFCIHLACKWSNWEIPQSSEGKDWFWYVDKTVTLEQLELLTAEFLVIYDKCPSKLRRKIRSASSHDVHDSRSTSIPDHHGETPFKFSDSDPKFNAPIQHGPIFDPIEQKVLGSSDKPQPSSALQATRTHGEPSRVDYRDYREKKEREKQAQLSNKGLPSNSKHTTTIRHPSHQYHASKAPPVGHTSSQMNPTRRDGNSSRDPNKPREAQPNPMFPPAIRHDPSVSATGITPTTSMPSKPIPETEDDKSRLKPLLKDHQQSGQRLSEPFNHKYPNADHRHRRDHCQPDGGHHLHKNPVDPSKYLVKPRPPIPGLEIKKEKEEEQNKRLSIPAPINNTVKPIPSRTSAPVPSLSKPSKPRPSKNGTSESLPILPTHNYNSSSNLTTLNPTALTSSNTTTTITTTTTTTSTISSSTMLSTLSTTHSLLSDPPDLTNPTAVSNLLHQTPPQQIRQPRESPYPSRSKSSAMSHPLVPNRPRTTTPLSNINSPPIPGKSNRNRNRTNSSSSEELIPVVKKLDEIPGYENILRDSQIGAGGIKLPGRVPEMILPIRDRRNNELSPIQPLPVSTNLPTTTPISNRIKEEIRVKEDIPITTLPEATNHLYTTPIVTKIENSNELLPSENNRISSSSIDQSIIDVVSIPEPLEKLISPPPSEAVRINTESTPIQDDLSRSKKAAKHHKSDKKKRKEKSKDKDRDRDRDKEKKKKKHKEKDKEREKVKESHSSAPIKIKIPKDKLNLHPTPENTDSNSSSGLKIKIPKDRLIHSETPTTSTPLTTTVITTTPTQGGLKIKISKDVYENFNKEPRKRSATDSSSLTITGTSVAPPAKAPRLSESRHRSTTSNTMPYGKQNGQPAPVGSYNKMTQKMAESINVQSKGKNSSSSHP